MDYQLHDFATTLIIAVIEWKGEERQRGRTGYGLPGAAYPKAVPRYVEVFCENGIKRYFAEAVWNRFITEGTELKVFPSIEERCVIVRDIAYCRDEVEGETGRR